MAKKYRVTITEALKRTVDVTAECKEAAEQISATHGTVASIF